MYFTITLTTLIPPSILTISIGRWSTTFSIHLVFDMSCVSNPPIIPHYMSKKFQPSFSDSLFFSFLFSFRIHRYLSSPSMAFSTSFSRILIRLRSVWSSFVRKFSSIRFDARRLILRKRSVLFSFSLTNYSCLFVFFFTVFGRDRLLFQCTLRKLVEFKSKRSIFITQTK